MREICWQLSLKGDKRNLVQEMTRDIHTHQNRGQVLTELAACVAAGKGHTPPITSAQRRRLPFIQYNIQ